MGEAPVVAETMDLDTVTVLRGAAAVGNLGCTLMREAGAVGDGQYGGGGTAWNTEKIVTLYLAQQAHIMLHVPHMNGLLTSSYTDYTDKAVPGWWAASTAT